MLTWLRPSNRFDYTYDAERVEDRGGIVEKMLTPKTDYVVIDSKHYKTTLVRNALVMKLGGGKIKLISEEVFAEIIARTPTVAQELYSVAENGELNLCGETTIRARAFDSDETLKSIRIPEGVEHIGEDAFRYCKNLQEVIFPESLISIEFRAFGRCEALKSIEMRGRLELIGSFAFDCCTSLSRVILNNGLKEIGIYAFESCKALESIALNEGLEEIDDYAFLDCEKLESIAMPRSVCTIGCGAFKGALKLQMIRIPGKVKWIRKETFFNCKELREVILEEGIESIAEEAFAGCEKMSELILPSSIKSVEKSAFQESGCKTLTIMGDQSDAILETLLFSKEAVMIDIYRLPEAMRRWERENKQRLELQGFRQRFEYLTPQQIKMIEEKLQPPGNKPVQPEPVQPEPKPEPKPEVKPKPVRPEPVQPEPESKPAIESIQPEPKPEPVQPEVKAEMEPVRIVEASVMAELYVILRNEQLQGKLHRDADEFCEFYAEDFPNVPAETLKKQREAILQGVKGEIRIPTVYAEEFKSRPTAEKVRIATLNLFNISMKADFDEETKQAMWDTACWYASGERNEVEMRMQNNLIGIRRDMDDQYRAINPAWLSFATAKHHLRLKIEDMDYAERDDESSFQKIVGNQIAVVALAESGQAFRSVRMIDCMPWYWKTTREEIWRAACYNLPIDNRKDESTGSASSFVQKVRSQVLGQSLVIPAVKQAEMRAQEMQNEQLKEKTVKLKSFVSRYGICRRNTTIREPCLEHSREKGFRSGSISSLRSWRKSRDGTAPARIRNENGCIYINIRFIMCIKSLAGEAKDIGRIWAGYEPDMGRIWGGEAPEGGDGVWILAAAVPF